MSNGPSTHHDGRYHDRMHVDLGTKPGHRLRGRQERGGVGAAARVRMQIDAAEQMQYPETDESMEEAPKDRGEGGQAGADKGVKGGASKQTYIHRLEFTTCK